MLGSVRNCAVYSKLCAYCMLGSVRNCAVYTELCAYCVLGSVRNCAVYTELCACCVLGSVRNCAVYTELCAYCVLGSVRNCAAFYRAMYQLHPDSTCMKQGVSHMRGCAEKWPQLRPHLSNFTSRYCNSSTPDSAVVKGTQNIVTSSGESTQNIVTSVLRT